MKKKTFQEIYINSQKQTQFPKALINPTVNNALSSKTSLLPKQKIMNDLSFTSIKYSTRSSSLNY